jgi:surface antigen
MGHAKDWLTSARVHRLPYDQVPQLGDVAVFINGEAGFSQLYGHVAMVIGVNEERDQFSTAGWDGFKADCQLEVHRDLPVTANTFFIHRRLSPEEASGGDYPFWEPATLDVLQVYSELQ